MARPADDHLSEEDIERLVSNQSGDDSGGFEKARNHLESCAICQDRRLLIESQQGMLKSLPLRAVAPQPGCPTEDLVRQLSAGILPSAGGGRSATACRQLRLLRPTVARIPGGFRR